MGRSKVANTLDDATLTALDRLVSERRFPNRSRAIEEAVTEKLARLKRSRLARESAKLDRSLEQHLAEKGLAEDAGTWPE